jgi:Fe-S cluster assembly protein SufD
MSTLATLPTTHDEDWRYADPDWLAAADPVALGQWRDVAVPAGETVRETGVVSEGVERTRVHVGAGGRFELFLINAAGPYARAEVEVTLEEGAHFEFGGVTIGGGDKRQEFVTRVLHSHPNATSGQTVRAVQWGRSIGNFLGRIEVARDAQKTDASQNFKAILLEKGASANAKPELEIFADDVKCAHGAAIGAMDQAAAFYMAARGIPPEAARKLLIRAFVADAFHALDDAALRDTLLEQALAALDEEVV